MGTSRAAKIWKRTWVGFLLASGLAALLWLTSRSESGLVLYVVGGLAALGAVYELSRMGRFRDQRLFGTLLWPLLAVLLLQACELGRWFDEGGSGTFRSGPWLEYAVAPVSALAVHGLRRGGGPSALLVAGLALWVVPALPVLRHIWLGWGVEGLIALVLLSKIGDVFGYYVGNAIGKTHPFPGVSPGKTTAGCVASLLAGTALGAALVGFGLLSAEPLGLLGGALAGAALNLAAQAGDLLESKAKRWSGVKDSGTWFGPSGGVLDLVDSLLLAIPVALLLWPLLFDLP